MSREERIANLKIADNVGLTDNVDLFALTEEKFSELGEEVFEDPADRES